MASATKPFTGLDLFDGGSTAQLFSHLLDTIQRLEKLLDFWGRPKRGARGNSERHEDTEEEGSDVCKNLLEAEERKDAVAMSQGRISFHETL